MGDLNAIMKFMQSEGSDKAAEMLAQTDGYIQMYHKLSGELTLPKSHARLRPLVETFAEDLGGFVEFVREVRDGMTRNDDGYSDIHALYRLIQTRHVQQQRRERIGRAVEQAKAMYGDTNFQTRQRWIAMLEHKWAKRRLKYMDAVRRGSGVKRLTTEQRAVVAAEFWDMLDKEIDAGEGIPKWG